MSISEFLARHPIPPLTRAPIKDVPAAIEATVEVEEPEIGKPGSNAAGTPFYWDVETRSAAVLGGGKYGVGPHAYSEHVSTSVLCVGYARGDAAVQIWVPGQPVPEDVLAAAADPHCVWVAHNAAFERAILTNILVPLHNWPAVPVERHVCTMALALAHAYPGSLEDVAKILGLTNQKDAAREKIVRGMWKPRKPRRGEDPTKIYWIDTPELRSELAIYNRHDLAAERELHQHPRMPPLPASEQDTWVLDAEINDHGVLIDALAEAASRLAAQALAELNERMRLETDGAVTTASKTPTLKLWLVQQGVVLPSKLRMGKKGKQWSDSLDAEGIEKLLAGELPHPGVRAVLEIRLQAAQAAAAKVDRMLRTRCADSRVRGLFKFYGATTGRWSGAGVQPQNLKRPELLRTDAAIAEGIELVLAGDYAAVKDRYADVLGIVGDLCRGMIIPAPGHRFIVGDFRAIEARVLAWLVGDEAELEAFRQFDLGLGPDIYLVTAEQILGAGIDPAIARPLGKIFKLGLGYGMGADKLLSTIQKAGLRGPGANRSELDDISLVDAKRWVDQFRASSPKICAYWAGLNVTAMAAVRNPGMPLPCRSATFEMRGSVLFLRLPSGRELSYPAPVVRPGRFGGEEVAFTDMEAGRRRGRHLYGGAWTENVTQAVARDLLVDAMKRLHARDYQITLHAHDEIAAEMPLGAGSVEEFERLLIEVPDWAQGLPIAAKVFECLRFKKD